MIIEVAAMALGGRTCRGKDYSDTLIWRGFVSGKMHLTNLVFSAAGFGAEGNPHNGFRRRVDVSHLHVPTMEPSGTRLDFQPEESSQDVVDRSVLAGNLHSDTFRTANGN